MGVALAQSPRGARLLPSEPRLPETVHPTRTHPRSWRLVAVWRIYLVALLCVTAQPAAAAGPFPDRVADLSLGEGGGFNQHLRDIVLGGPRGAGLLHGSLDVLSLGRGGQITLEFVDSAIVDCPGPDFIVFENPFLISAGNVTGDPFAEPGQVLVSADGTDFVAFPCALDDADNFYPGCAGVIPVLANVDDPAAPQPTVPTTVSIESFIGLPLPPDPPGGAGGDSFDLTEVGLDAVRFVRIVSGAAAFPAGEGQAGFDLDAVAAVNWRPVNSDGADDPLPSCQGAPDDGNPDADDDGTDDPNGSNDGGFPLDSDADGVPDETDNCPSDHNPQQGDSDGDRVGDACDRCPTEPDPLNLDADVDQAGDACDPCPDDASCGPAVAPAFIGGRRTRAREHLLSFAAPAARVTVVPSETLFAEVWVNFGAAVEPDTLRVKVQGADLTALFTPVVRGASRRAKIPLGRRRTRVSFRIKGTKKNGTRTRDVDRLVFRRRRK